MDEGARRLVQTALGSWATTFRLCIIVIVVVAAATLPSWPFLGLAPRVFMT
jgi:hypothetical protein